MLHAVIIASGASLKGPYLCPLEPPGAVRSQVHDPGPWGPARRSVAGAGGPLSAAKSVMSDVLLKTCSRLPVKPGRL